MEPGRDACRHGIKDNTARIWNADGSGQPIVLEGHDGIGFHRRVEPGRDACRHRIE